MRCKIAIVFLSFIAAILSQPLVDEDENPELGPYFEGDILNPPKEGDKSGINDLRRRWRQNTFVYLIGPNFSQEERRFLYQAMNEIRSKTCIRFREATKNDPDYAVYTKAENGCNSYVGRVGGKQVINLAAACFRNRHGTVMHETIHALGFGHEQNRPDREDFVSIDWQKIQPHAKYNFEVNSQQSRTFYVPYDYNSIMHYGKTAFGKKKGDITIHVKDEKAGANIGQRAQLSRGDAEKLSRMYDCWQRPRFFQY